MKKLCQHCATPYAEGSGVDGFCCAGCRQVYALIREEGLGEYYRWQDRAAQPLKDRQLSDLDEAALRGVQSEVEAGADTAEALFAVAGMSCTGCAWLVERLAANRPGLVEAESSLSAHTVRLRWRASGFDLAAFAAELWRFGYRLEAKALRLPTAPRLSPLALRLLLSTVFAANALLLAAYTHYIGRSTLADLLSLACLCFTLLVGGAPFFLSASRAARIRRWHSDGNAVLLLSVTMLFLGHQVLFAGMHFSMAAFLVSLLVCVLLSARIASRRIMGGR